MGLLERFGAMGRLNDTGLSKGTYGRNKDGSPKRGNGIYSDGDGLYLRVQGANKSWLFIYRFAGKRREMGIGAYQAVTLAGARELATGARHTLKVLKRDPLAERDAARAAAKAAAAAPVMKVWTFGEVAQDLIDSSMGNLTAAVRARYAGYLRNHLAAMVPVKVREINAGHVDSALAPIWKTATGPFVRNFIERVLKSAVRKGHREPGLDIISHEAVSAALGKVDRTNVNHASLPWAEVPAFMSRLAGIECASPQQATGRACLQFAILCGLRQGEARGLRWGWIKDDCLVIPAEAYKTRREHAIPLSAAAKAVLDTMARGSNREPDALVFRGRLDGRPLSSHTFEYILAGMQVAVKPHGFRSSFVGWGRKAGKFGSDLMQQCLGHVILSKVAEAYDRESYVEEMRPVFDGWAAFVGA